MKTKIIALLNLPLVELAFRLAYDNAQTVERVILVVSLALSVATVLAVVVARRR